MEEKEGNIRPQKAIKMCVHMHMEGQVASLFLKAYHMHITQSPSGSQKHT